ncbi:hypothetical protein ACFVTM_17265 [Arthrobacter sp. NPDC058130]
MALVAALRAGDVQNAVEVSRKHVDILQDHVHGLDGRKSRFHF